MHGHVPPYGRRRVLQLSRRRVRSGGPQRIGAAPAPAREVQCGAPRRAWTRGNRRLAPLLRRIAVKLSTVRAFLDERLGLDVLQALAHKKRVPIHGCSHFYYLGGMGLFLFLVQIVTGVLLSLYYKPAPDHAFESVRAIMTEVEFGWLIRSAHSWSANLLIGVLFLHLLTAFMMRAYRRPREMTWVTGVLLLGVFLAFGFSGYLLPW